MATFSPTSDAKATQRPQLAHLTAQLDALRAQGTYFRLRELDDQQAPVCTYDGKRVINLASNNYCGLPQRDIQQAPVGPYDGKRVITLASNNSLGLCNPPKLEEAAIAATKKF